jgi:hypothetical protein
MINIYSKTVLIFFIASLCLMTFKTQAQSEYISRKILYNLFAGMYDSSTVYKNKINQEVSFKTVYVKDTLVDGLDLKVHLGETAAQIPFFEFYYGGNIEKISGFGPYIEYDFCPKDGMNWGGPLVYRKSLNQLITKTTDTTYVQNCMSYCGKVDSITLKINYTIDHNKLRLISETFNLDTNGDFVKSDYTVNYFTKYENDDVWYVDSIWQCGSIGISDIKLRRIYTYKNNSVDLIEYVKTADGQAWVQDNVSLSSYNYIWSDINTIPYVVTKINYSESASSGKYYFSKNAIVLSVDDSQLIGTTKIYPIPATQTLHVESSQLLMSYSIIDLAGKSLQAGELEANTIDLNNLRSGVYVLKLQTLNETKMLKFVKE